MPGGIGLRVHVRLRPAPRFSHCDRLAPEIKTEPPAWPIIPGEDTAMTGCRRDRLAERIASRLSLEARLR
jgi:hypothetical protein